MVTVNPDRVIPPSQIDRVPDPAAELGHNVQGAGRRLFCTAQQTVPAGQGSFGIEWRLAAAYLGRPRF